MISDTKEQGHAADSEKRKKCTNQEFKSDTEGSNSKAQNQTKEDKTASSSAEVHASSKNDFKLFQRKGDRIFKEGRFKAALVSFENAKKHMKHVKQIELMHLFCNIADCYLHLEQYKDVLEEITKFQTVTEKSYQVGIRTSAGGINCSTSIVSYLLCV